MERLKVNGRYLQTESGKDFFYLADTGWEILHRLSREEMAEYFRIRVSQGFTCIQTVALAELDGLREPNVYGRRPLKETAPGIFDPCSPDLDGPYSYWDHVDYALDEAERQGLYLVLLPTWGDKWNLLWGKGPVIFDPVNAFGYGRFLGERYKDRSNLIWMLGGDRPAGEEHRRILDAMAEGIRKAGDAHLMTFHPCGTHRSTEIYKENDVLDFHTAQTGHGIEQCLSSDEVMLQMSRETQKPFMDSEPRYEDHPACFRPELGVYWSDVQVRQNAYWDVLSGTCGHTYGNHAVWSVNRTPSGYFPFTFREVLRHPGAEQIGYVRRLRLSRDYASYRRDDTILRTVYPGEGHMVSGRGKDYIYIYSPLGLPFETREGLFEDAEALKALWFDPRTGEEKVYSILNPDIAHCFVPPAQGTGKDWVLILEKIGPKK